MIHLFCWAFCVVRTVKSSAKVDRLTVTSVSELETDWRLVLCCLCLVPSHPRQQPFQTSRPIPSPPLIGANPPKEGLQLHCTKIECPFWTFWTLWTSLVVRKWDWTSPETLFLGLNFNRNPLFLPRGLVQHLGAFKRDSFNLSDPAGLVSSLMTSDIWPSKL